MDKLDSEGAPEKDGEMNFEDCATSFDCLYSIYGLWGGGGGEDINY